jgi:hypothetical protein
MSAKDIPTTINDSTSEDLSGPSPGDTDFPSLPKRVATEALNDKVKLALKSLHSLTIADLTTALKEVESKKLSKQSRDLTKAADLVPGISSVDKYILIPEAKEEDHPNRPLYKALAVIADKLGYTVYELPEYTGKKKDISEDSEKFSCGISFTVSDTSNHFNMSEKMDLYEDGRTYARSQQIIGIFSDNVKLGLNALKKNHRFFGNNPGETKIVGRSSVPVSYKARTIRNIFREENWSEQLEALTNSLLHKYHVFLEQDVRDIEIRKNCITYSDAVLTYCSREIVTGKVRGQDIIKVKVPHKPRSSNLLLKEEQKVINDLIDPLFSDGIPAGVDKFVDYVLEKGFNHVIKALKEKASKKAEFLQKFSSLTTRRLTQLRAESPSELKSKRKKDLGVHHVQTLIAKRANPYDDFVNEVLNLDPKLEIFLSQFKVCKALDGTLDRVATKQKLNSYVRSEIRYTEAIPKEVILANQGEIPHLTKTKESAVETVTPTSLINDAPQTPEESTVVPEKTKGRKQGKPWFVPLIDNALEAMQIGARDVKLYAEILKNIGEDAYYRKFGEKGNELPDLPELTKAFPSAVAGPSSVRRL